jgi:hypothetical protein
MSNYYTYMPQELPAPNNGEETPEASIQIQPTSGNFKTCYICGLDFSKYQENYAVRKTYGLQTDKPYVITVCVFCSHQHLRR